MDPFTLAVCESPDDDTPRLVYADWLDENDDPDRAAFIRLQCELASLTEDSPRRREVAYLARQLEDRHAADWSPPDWQVLEYRFARGFVEMAGLTAENLEHEHTAFLFGLNPIRRLWVTGMNGDVQCVRRCVPRTNTVTALDLTGNDLTADALRDLAGFAQFAGVRELGLLFNRLDDEAAQVLCGEAFFQQLTLIRCGANPMTDAGRQRLRDHFGDRVTFVAERDAGHLYAFQDYGDRFTAGFGNDYTQLLWVAWRSGLELGVFDHTGTLLETQHLPVPQGESYQELIEKVERVRRSRLTELGFASAIIRVKRFQFPDGSGVDDYPELLVEDFETPTPEDDDAQDWRRSWLEDGSFRYDYGGDDCWLNRAGVVTDT